MQFNSKHKLAAGAAVLAAAAGTGGALAATQSSSGSPRQAFVTDVAHRLNVSPQALDGAMQAAFFDRLDTAVAAGRLTRVQADRIEKRVRKNGSMPWLGGLGHHHGLHGRRALIKAAAGYLGLTRTALITQLQGGRSLAQITQTQGKSLSGLEAALSTGVRARLDRAVARGRMTLAREQQILAKLPARLGRFVNHRGLAYSGRHG